MFRPVPAGEATTLASAAQKGARHERIHALDSLRAAAMFLGIVLHAALSFAEYSPIPWPAADVSRHWSFDLLIAGIHGFRMQLFFLLAGFFARLLYFRHGPAGFLKQRLKRIGAPLALGWVMMMPLFWLIWTWGIQRMKDPEAARKLAAGSDGGIPTAHLWFLEYLLIFYAFAVLAVWLRGRMPEKGRKAASKSLQKILHTPMRTMILAAFSVVPLWNGPFWGEPEIPGIQITPTAGGLAYYGLFFAAGWAAHLDRAVMARFQRGVPAQVFVCIGAYLFYGWIVTADRLPDPGMQNYLPFKVAALFCAAFYAWGISFAAIGWFMRAFPSETKWGRYLADASYWCYLAHLPLVNFLQVAAAPIQASALAKFGALLLVTMSVLLLTYEYSVRHTFVGRLLNGPRDRRL